VARLKSLCATSQRRHDQEASVQCVPDLSWPQLTGVSGLCSGERALSVCFGRHQKKRKIWGLPGRPANYNGPNGAPRPASTGGGNITSHSRVGLSLGPHRDHHGNPTAAGGHPNRAAEPVRSWATTGGRDPLMLIGRLSVVVNRIFGCRTDEFLLSPVFRNPWAVAARATRRTLGARPLHRAGPAPVFMLGSSWYRAIWLPTARYDYDAPAHTVGGGAVPSMLPF